jgi:hypothetical protein
VWRCCSGASISPGLPVAPGQARRNRRGGGALLRDWQEEPPPCLPPILRPSRTRAPTCRARRPRRPRTPRPGPRCRRPAPRRGRSCRCPGFRPAPRCHRPAPRPDRARCRRRRRERRWPVRRDVLRLVGMPDTVKPLIGAGQGKAGPASSPCYAAIPAPRMPRRAGRRCPRSGMRRSRRSGRGRRTPLSPLLRPDANAAARARPGRAPACRGTMRAPGSRRPAPLSEAPERPCGDALSGAGAGLAAPVSTARLSARRACPD